MPIALFMNGIPVEVPEGTVLIFNPISLSVEALNAMPNVQFHAGITFQTKVAVLEKVPDSVFYKQHLFHDQHHNNDNESEMETDRMHISEQEEQKDENRIQFFSLIFDFMRRKYDDEYALPHIDQLSFQQMHHFKLLCNYLLPGMFLGWDTPSCFESDITASIMMDPNQQANLLASQELLSTDSFSNFLAEINAPIQNNNVHAFRNLLLNKVNRLAMRAWAWNQPEEGLLHLLSNVEVTPARLQMLSILFNPHEFGGRFFLDSEGNHTVFTELIKSIAVPQTEYALEYRNSRSVEERFADLQAIVQHLVMELGMPVHVTNRGGFRILPYDEPLSLLDLAASHADWIAFAVFVHHFPRQDYYNLVSGHLLTFCRSLPVAADFPACVQLILPYISDSELKIALHQIKNTLKALELQKASKSKDLTMHYNQVFMMTKHVIESAIVGRGLVISD